MTKPAYQAEPYFSQPVRQVTMMLVALALVGIGAYFAYGRIFSIFLASPWLNGAILGVFVLGVVGCFLQVAQLVSSVSWIEGFVFERPGAGLAEPPRLLAPLAALLRSRGARAQITTSSARSILESVATRIDEARDITRYLSNLLIFLGLLGTFYGLAITVPGVVDTIRALAPEEGQSAVEVFEKLMGGLETQLGGMGTAFSSSLLGLAGSLVVGLLELFASHGQNRFYRELEEWLSSITRLGFASGEGEGADGAALAGVVEQMAGQMEALGALIARGEADRTQADGRLAALAGVLDRLGRRMEAEAGMAATLSRIAEGQERMIAALGHREIAEAEGPDAESRMRLRSIDTQLLRLFEEIAAGRQESMADLRADLALLTRSVRALGRQAQAAPDGRAGG